MANAVYKKGVTELKVHHFADTDLDLEKYAFIEIGTIERIYNRNRCTVRGNRLRAGKVWYYEDIEILYAGITIIPAGTPCLLFRPRTSVPDTRSGIVDVAAPVYGRSGMKAVPLVQGITGMDMGYDGSGNLIVHSAAGYTLRFSSDAVTLSAGGAPLFTFHPQEHSADFDLANGRFHKFYGNDKYKMVHFDGSNQVTGYDEILDDGTRKYYRGATGPIKISDLDNVDNYQTVVTENPDGTLNIVYGEDCTLDVKEADIELSVGSDLSVSIDGDNTKTNLTVKDVTVDIDGAGKKTEVKSGDVTVTLDGQSKAMTFDDGTNKIETGSSGCTITTSACKIEMTASGVKINNHLSVTP